MYRHLTEIEINVLKNNLCQAENWANVYVKDGFNPQRVILTSFYGVVKLGNFNKNFTLPGGVQFPSGIKGASLHDVEVGDDSCIENISNFISNYKIGSGCYIKNVSMIYVDGISSFGNGVEVSVLNETGGREVPINMELSSHLAYYITLYRHRIDFQKKVKQLSDDFVKVHSSSIGTIGNNVYIVNTGKIKNVNIFDCAVIEGASVLENGTINSNRNDCVKIGYNVTCRNFIISSGAIINDGASIDKCFVGQSCELMKGYSATDSLFFANCYGSNGEACSVFAGPYTVTHHKSTLLIAGMFSFMNAGSGSNQSNHMYKLGPIHQGILERGVKTTSDSYILFPAQVGAFSLVMGRHVDNLNTTDLPFSYLIENHNKTYIVPGVNLKSVGTIRDAQKWPKRDKRKDPKVLDYINFNLLSPFTIQKMMKGMNILQDLKSDGISKEYLFGKAVIAGSALERGIQYYHLGITKFLGNSLISKIYGKEISSDEELREVMKPSITTGLGDWTDTSGLICPKSEVTRLMDDVENGTIDSIYGINERFKELSLNYYEYEWTWAYSKLFDYFGFNKESFTRQNALDIISQWIDAVIAIDRMVYEDARKEFSLSAMTSFGVDGDKRQLMQDFEQVRGTFESNLFVTSVLQHIETKSKLADDMKKQLN